MEAGYYLHFKPYYLIGSAFKRFCDEFDTKHRRTEFEGSYRLAFSSRTKMVAAREELEKGVGVWVRTIQGSQNFQNLRGLCLVVRWKGWTVLGPIHSITKWGRIW